MEHMIRCQSCGMPLGQGFFGTEADGAESADYCKFCYQKGVFTEPTLSLEAMIKTSIQHMTTKLHMTPEEAEKLSRMHIPRLKRWQRASGSVEPR